MANWRSPKLLDTARQAPCCFGCGRYNDGSVVAAHSNWSEHSKGMSIKAHDWAIAYLCGACHFEIDQGHTMLREARKEFWQKAHIKTLEWLFDAGILGVK